jgi:hypothetical protein
MKSRIFQKNLFQTTFSQHEDVVSSSIYWSISMTDDTVWCNNSLKLERMNAFVTIVARAWALRCRPLPSDLGVSSIPL